MISSIDDKDFNTHKRTNKPKGLFQCSPRGITIIRTICIGLLVSECVVHTTTTNTKK